MFWTAPAFTKFTTTRSPPWTIALSKAGPTSAGGATERRAGRGDAAIRGPTAETVIANHPATGYECTVHSAAVNAVMAGCKAEYFPV